MHSPPWRFAAAFILLIAALTQTSLTSFARGDSHMAGDGEINLISEKQYEKDLKVANQRAQVELNKAKSLPLGDVRRARALLSCYDGLTHLHALYDQQKPMLQEAVQILERNLPGALETAVAQYKLGQYFQNRGFDMDAGKAWYLKAIPGYEAHINEVLASYLRNLELQNMYTSTKQLDKLKAYVFKLTEHTQKHQGSSTNSLVMGLMTQIGQSEVSKDYKQAETALRQVMQIISAQHAPSHDLAELHIRLGTALEEQNRLQEALSEYGMALEIDKVVFPDRFALVSNHIFSGPLDNTSPHMTDSIKMGDVLLKMGRHAEARLAFDRVVDIANHFDTDARTRAPVVSQAKYVKKRHFELNRP